jgi:FMN-dependent oxidoreductase (nitrilotriacetate monooxygenase family)
MQLDHWVELAKLAEKGKVDALFFADQFGMSEGAWELVVENALHFPNGDPSVLISAMAYATSELGFIFTNSVMQQHPYTFARIATTLDHLTKGRLGWNVVTSPSSRAAKAMGVEGAADHDERYQWAEEYVGITYRLWEGSWEDGAVIHDRERGVFTDPTKVHAISHLGKRYRVEGPHMCEPSPQRTPVIFQAGSSAVGQAFAGRHAEGVFIVSGSPEAAAKKVASLRQAAVDQGRSPSDIVVLEGLTVIVGSTMEEARRKAKECEDCVNSEVNVQQLSGMARIDVSQYALSTPLSEVMAQSQGIRSILDMVIDTMPPGEVATVNDLLHYSARKMRIVGTPESVCDELAAYAAAGVDGFNLMYAFMPGTFDDFVEYVAPVLQKRGLMKSEYTPGTLREKLFARGARVPRSHPAYQCRVNKADEEALSV